MDCNEAITSEEYVDYIIDYSGNADILEAVYGEECYIILDRRYAVLYRKKPEDYMEIFSRYEYSLFPKLYGLLDTSSMEAAGVINVQRENVLGLTGSNTIIGIIDTGLDIENTLFRNPAGRTRVLSAWDQSVGNGENTLYGYGTEYTQEDIQTAIDSNNEILRDANGHGTFMTGIAAGGATADFTGVAPDASIIVVKLKPAKLNLRNLYGVPADAEAYEETDIMLAVAYLLYQASKFQQNISILLGVGSNSGSHTGTGALESFITNIGILKGIAISVAGGNEGVRGHHFQDTIGNNEEYAVVELNVANNDSFTMEIWGAAPNTYSIAIEIPGGEFISRIPPRFDRSTVIRPIFGGGTIYVDYFLVEEQSGEELIMLRFFGPQNGLWRIRVYGTGDTEKSFHAWLPLTGFISPETVFIRPSPNVTLTNPATAETPMSVCAYNHYDNGIYINNSRGYTADNRIKPDFLAPGVEVYGPGRAGTFVRRSGTSVAAAHCAGCAALMLQWATERDLVRFINGNQIRRYFIRGAIRLNNPNSALPPGSGSISGDPDRVGNQIYREYPNPEWGWGILNIFNTFEQLRN